jgi:hypothetical protein
MNHFEDLSMDKAWTQFVDGALTANEIAQRLISYRARFEHSRWQNWKLRIAWRLLNWL